ADHAQGARGRRGDPKQGHDPVLVRRRDGAVVVARAAGLDRAADRRAPRARDRAAAGRGAARSDRDGARAGLAVTAAGDDLARLVARQALVRLPVRPCGWARARVSVPGDAWADAGEELLGVPGACAVDPAVLLASAVGPRGVASALAEARLRLMPGAHLLV